jgi:ribA/ribD-fused uncharacterized protein
MKVALPGGAEREESFKSAEHAFQALKFAPTSAAAFREVQNAATPKEARKLGKVRSRPLRADWEDAKVPVMMQCVRAKFGQNADCAELLLSTGEKELQEASPFDYCWGIGRSGTGKNHLGKILMAVRAELRGKRQGERADAKKERKAESAAKKKKTPPRG